MNPLQEWPRWIRFGTYLFLGYVFIHACAGLIYWLVFPDLPDDALIEVPDYFTYTNFLFGSLMAFGTGVLIGYFSPGN
jgi:hypothetical protein